VSLPFPLFLCVPRDTGDLHLIGFHLIFLLTSLTVSAYSSELFIFDLLSFSSVPIAFRHLAPLSEIHMHPYFLLHKCISVPIPVICTIGVLLDHLKGLDGSHLPLGRACPLNFGLAQVYNILKHHFNLSQVR